MILFPAVDILEGKAVRLARGDFDERTVYAEDPVGAARAWAQAGARFLHVVDLDGARAGAPVNLEHVERIVREVEVPVQVGGGLRSLEAVEGALRAGASRVVLGTAAYADVDFLDAVLAAHRDRVVVSVDVRDGRVAAAGWTEQTGMLATDVIAGMQDRGVKRFVYSNIDKDGMLEGPDPEEVREIARGLRGSFVYSGGVSAVEDLAALAGLRLVNLAGVIVGKALYERRFTVAEGQAALEEGRCTASA